MQTATSWQLIPYCEASGADQMALDDALLERHSYTEHAPAILRFYTWSPAAISLGYHQRQVPSHWQSLAQNFNLDIVRRPSGGRAVLHKGDLTYVVITKTLGNKRRDTYEYICGFLMQGLAKLGIQLQYGAKSSGYIHNPSCFSSATAADLVASNGKKLIGSAQVYRRDSVLQHGSIALQPDHVLLEKVFSVPVPVVGLTGLLESNHPWQNCSYQEVIVHLVELLTESAAEYFQANFI